MDYTVLTKLEKDIKAASKNLGRDEARFLVDSYYLIQDMRLRIGGQIRSRDGSEPFEVLEWAHANTEALESRIQKVLHTFSDSWQAGVWMKSITGIGPVIAAGMLAHLDIRQANTACCFWRFAGLDPSSKWEKGQNRPWNAALKVLCWKLGESFVKVHNNENDYYGKIYAKWKVIYNERNESREYRTYCTDLLKSKNFNKSTQAYKKYSQGKLPKAQIHARARRKAVKLFLAHLHQVMYEEYHSTKAPIPYIFVEKNNTTGHVHYLPPPNWPMEEAKGGKLTNFLNKSTISDEITIKPEC